MDDYISRQAAVDIFGKLSQGKYYTSLINAIPAADVIELGERYYFKDKYLFEIKADENGRNEWFRIERAEQ